MIRHALATIFLSLVVIVSGCNNSDGQSIEIAVATDLADKDEKRDTIFLGASLMVQEINEKGGINGMPLTLSVYDDEGTAAGAKKAAQQIVDDGRAVAVIGHRLSDASIAAGPIYKANKIPVITPASTSPSVTINNDWYFRSLFNNDFLGRFMGYYVVNVMQPDTIYVAHGASNYEKKLAEIFVETVSGFGIKAEPLIVIKGSSDKIEKDAKEITKAIKAKQGSKGILLALYPDTASPLIRALRDQSVDITMLGPDTLAKKSFPEGFAQLPSEKRKPGFYTDGIQVASPLVFDTANWRAGLFREEFVSRFNIDPDWRSAYAYDSAGTLAEAIRRAAVFSQAQPSVQDARNAIREELVKMKNFATGYTGITGSTFFDEKGDANKPVAIAEFQARQLVSAFRQLQALSQVPTGARLENIEEDLGALDLGGTLMEKTNVVYTGIDLDRIWDVDPREMRAKVAGFIWFRYQLPKTSGHIWQGEKNGFDPSNIDFNNAIGDVEYKPVAELEVSGDTYYQQFFFEGTFRTDFVSGLKQYGSPTVGISYRHKSKPSGLLLYVPDIVGMGLTGGQSYADTLGSSKYSLLAEGWVVEKASVFQGTKWARVHGKPEFLNSTNARNPHSMITAAIRVGTPKFFFSSEIKSYYYPTIAWVALAVFLLIFGYKRVSGKDVPALLMLLELTAAIFAITAGRKATINAYQDMLTFDQLTIIDAVFSSLLWLVSAYFIIWIIDRVVWSFLERKTQRSIPDVARFFVASIIYIVAGFGIVAFVLDKPLTSLLATSGLLTFIIGLAVQNNLANIFSGLIISIDRPFVIGDYIQFDGHWGKIIDMGWRATTIEDLKGSVVCVPNSTIAGATVSNYKQPSFEYYQDMFEVFVSPKYDADLVQKLLRKAIKATEGVKVDERIYIGFKGSQFSGRMSASRYLIFYFCDNYVDSWKIREHIWEEIQSEFVQNGISLDLRENERLDIAPGA